MGHLMLRNMEKVVAAVQQLTLEKDGVDGSQIQQYAEAWSFGEASARKCLVLVLASANCQKLLWWADRAAPSLSCGV